MPQDSKTTLGSESPTQPSSQNLGLPMNLGLIKDRATTEGRDIFSWASGQFESSGIQLLGAQAKERLHLEKGNQVPETSVLSTRT